MLAGVATTLAAKQKSSSEASRREQTHFSVEEDPTRVAALPEEVLDLLMADEFVVREQSCAKKTELPYSLFVATEIHLAGAQQPDFVIVGRGCLMGANIGPIWIVEETPQGFRVILKLASHDLAILPAKTRGYHDLRSVSTTANTISTTIWKFNGQKYVPTKMDLEPLP
jgi:hypothetical protein